jgi:hypothetical protein
MDLTQVLSVFKLSWDLPWRVFASIFAMTTIAGLWVNGSAFGFLARAAQWAGLSASTSDALTAAHGWLVGHAAVAGIAGLLLELVGLIFAGGRARSGSASRAPATVLIGASLAIESSWGAAAFALISAAIALWIVAAVVRIVYVARTAQVGWNNGIFLSEERLRRTWVSPLVAIFYVPLAPVAWAVRA